MLLDIRSDGRGEDPMRQSRDSCMVSGRFAGFLFLMFATLHAIANGQQPIQTDADKAAPSFEVAAIKANKGDSGHHGVDSNSDRISIENYTLRRLIRLAYDLKSDTQISGGPDWMDKQAFDISAKIDDSEVAKIRAMQRDERSKERSLLL